jgi:RimJ/RimL family protein N-acetyltransferase
MSDDLLLGPLLADPSPRALPVRQSIFGDYVNLEPLRRDHADDLWDELRDDQDSWTYVRWGPYASRDALADYIDQAIARPDHYLWAIRSGATGRIAGWLGLLDVQPQHASLEIGHVLFGKSLRRSRAATEALYLVMRHAFTDLSYLRMLWKCHNLNAASHRAAKRLGFTFEGVFRAHWIMKDRRRDSAFYSLLAEEWPSREHAMRTWLADANFDRDGKPIRGLEQMRASANPDVTTAPYTA